MARALQGIGWAERIDMRNRVVKAFCKVPMNLALGLMAAMAVDLVVEKAQAEKVELVEIPHHLLMTS